ncbi:MAG: hypothetical protein J5708_06260 [Bacteroidales bacterium]|nr:hypothetical protein [Bacteroidales bacterium]
MKKLIIFFVTIAVVLGMNQCKKQESPATHDTPVVSKWVRITMRVGGGRDMDTVYPGTGAVIYEEGDIIYVGNTGKYRGKLEYHNGSFSGLVADPVETDYLHFYYLGKLTPSTTPAINETTEFTVSIADQSVTLPIVSYGHSTTLYNNGISAYVCMLENKCGLAKFMAWPTPSTTNTAVTISGMKTTATISFDAVNPGITPTDATGAITLHKRKNSDPAERWAILLPQDETDATVSYINGATGNPIDQTITLPAIEANSFYGGYHGISVGIEWVDLGLSSKRLWAACNIGSCTHEGFGTFFAWAETEPKTTYCWHSYKYAFNPKFYPKNPSSAWITAEGSGYSSDDTLHHELGSNGKPNLGFFKYNNKAAYFAYEGGDVTGPNGEVVGGPDGVTMLDTEFNNDDVAVAKWGNGWHIPTREEWRTLINETTQTRDVVNGIGGVRFTGKAEGYTDKSIFLPFAGVYGGPMHSFYFGCGNLPHGEYWSNEIDSDYPYRAYILFFDDPDYSGNGGSMDHLELASEKEYIAYDTLGNPHVSVVEFIRNQGRPVRAVRAGDDK